MKKRALTMVRIERRALIVFGGRGIMMVTIVVRMRMPERRVGVIGTVIDVVNERKGIEAREPDKRPGGRRAAWHATEKPRPFHGGAIMTLGDRRMEGTRFLRDPLECSIP